MYINIETFAIVLLVAVVINAIIAAIDFVLDSKIATILANNLRIDLGLELECDQTFLETVDVHCGYLKPIANIAIMREHINTLNNLEVLTDDDNEQ